MRAPRKLRIIEDCPQPESPYKPVVMGCPLKPRGTPITANPAPVELHAIMFSQSARTKDGRGADPWSYADSVAHLRNAARVKRHGVTVPQPLCRSAQENTHTPVECAQAGSYSKGETI